ncbi:malate:quinone oxidoreductase [Psychroserpens sp.]
MDNVVLESSAAWNDAGAGHSISCELNYCPE